MKLLLGCSAIRVNSLLLLPWALKPGKGQEDTSNNVGGDTVWNVPPPPIFWG